MDLDKPQFLWIISVIQKDESPSTEKRKSVADSTDDEDDKSTRTYETYQAVNALSTHFRLRCLSIRPTCDMTWSRNKLPHKWYKYDIEMACNKYDNVTHALRNEPIPKFYRELYIIRKSFMKILC